jgi:hypothetical protein
MLPRSSEGFAFLSANNLKTVDIRKAVCEGMDWIQLAQDLDRDQLRALVNALINLRGP